MNNSNVKIYASQDWVQEKIDNVNLIIETDTSLSIESAAADAKTVGEKLALKADKAYVDDFKNSVKEEQGIWELLINHTVTAEESTASTIIFTKEAYPLIDGQKILFIRVAKPEAATGWWSLKADNTEVINGTGSNTSNLQLGAGVVINGCWLQSESQGSNPVGGATVSPGIPANYGANSTIRAREYSYYNQLSLYSYTNAWPEGTTIEIYGGRWA